MPSRSLVTLVKKLSLYAHLSSSAQILKTKGAVVETRFGTASVLKYPAKPCLSAIVEHKGTALRDAMRFVEVRASSYMGRNHVGDMVNSR